MWFLRPGPLSSSYWRTSFAQRSLLETPHLSWTPASSPLLVRFLHITYYIIFHFNFTLLRCNSHTIKCAHFKHAIQWVLTMYMPSNYNLNQNITVHHSPAKLSPAPPISILFTSTPDNLFCHYRLVLFVLEFQANRNLYYLFAYLPFLSLPLDYFFNHGFLAQSVWHRARQCQTE